MGLNLLVVISKIAILSSNDAPLTPKFRTFFLRMLLPSCNTLDEPTTIIYQNPKGFSPYLINSDDTIALRLTKDKFCNELIEKFGKPLISTSANISGEKTPFNFKAINKRILNDVDFIVPLSNNSLNQKVSRIVRLNELNEIEFLRK